MDKIEEFMDRIEKLVDKINEFQEELENRIEKLQEALANLKIENKERNEKWKPDFDERYWYYDRDLEEIGDALWKNDEEYSLLRYNAGVIFKTEKEAQDYADYQKAKKEYSHEFTKEEWKNITIEKWYIQYDFRNKELELCDRRALKTLSATYFETKEKAQEFIDKYEKQILKYEFGIEGD